VKTYVNGALYALLSEPIIREQAKALGTEELMGVYKTTADEVLLAQINYIVEQLNSCAPFCVCRLINIVQQRCPTTTHSLWTAIRPMISTMR
jgi:hypothetical protein